MKTTSIALCAAAAILAGSIGPANAARTKVVTVSIDGFCNVETVTIERGVVGNKIVETGDDCDENYGTGLYTRVKQVGVFANFGWTSANSPGTVFNMVFSKPFASDGSGQVTLYYTQDGATQRVIGPYTYEVVTDQARPNKSGLKPITSLVPRK